MQLAEQVIIRMWQTYLYAHSTVVIQLALAWRVYRDAACIRLSFLLCLLYVCMCVCLFPSPLWGRTQLRK